MPALCALLASVVWGVDDFAAGTVSRRLHPLRVVQLSQPSAFVVAVIAAGVSKSFAGPLGGVWWGLAAGVGSLVGLTSFYAALARGRMGVVAPIAATGVIVPVVVGLLQGESLGPLELAGMLVVIVGIVLASGPERRGSAPDSTGSFGPLLLAGVAALGFGTTLTCVPQGAESNLGVTLVAMRVSIFLGATIVLAAPRFGDPPELARRDIGIVALIGIGDVTAAGLYGLATSLGDLLSLSAVLASLYPAVTALLARQFHHERLARVQVAGVVATIAGVMLIAAGGGT